MQGFFNVLKIINVIHHIKKMIISDQKNFWKNSTSKTHQIAGIEGTYLNIIKTFYDIPTGNIKLNGEKL